MNIEKKNDKEFIIYAICAIALIVGCFRIPIGYYTFLRIGVFVASIVWITVHWEVPLSVENIVSAVVCILFNPIIPIYLHNKLAWVIIDAISAGWFAYLSVTSMRVRIDSQKGFF